jgi:hypothetical protein
MTNESDNLIGREQKFVHLTLALEANTLKTMSSKMPIWQHFLWILAPKICLVEERLPTILMEIQNLLEGAIFFPNLYRIHNLYILMDF